MKKFLKKIIVAILTAEAKLVLSRVKPKIIGVTGSVGKTSTKEAIYQVFSKLSTARKSQKSFNSEIGVPLTILNLNNAWSNPFLWIVTLIKGLFVALFSYKNFEWLILEIGADRPGDIKNITKWIKPDISVVTKIGKTPVHVEFFRNPKEVTKEKSHLAKALKKGGFLVALGDDEETMSIVEEENNPRTITFGFSEKVNLKASNYTILYDRKIENRSDFLLPMGISFKVNYDGNVMPVVIKGSLGIQQVYPVLGAIAVAISQKFNLVETIDSLRDMKTPPGRMKIIDGVKNSIIIDDGYNSSPVALSEALNTLENIMPPKGGRKIAVLGDMKELGDYSKDAHREAGKKASEVCDLILTVGELGKIIADSALDSGMDDSNIFQYESSGDAGKELQNFIKEGDIVLIKGSQGVRMEKVVKEVMANPEEAGELLVRQEEAWSKR